MKLSIIIATYNSMKTLPKVLDSIFNQTLQKDLYEIICVDGGSTDGTMEYIKDRELKVVENYKKEPVYAKFLGFKNAKGKFIIYLDHDEVILNNKSLEIKLRIFEENKYLKALSPTGYVNPKGYHFINDYINEFGDPFSFFIYKISKNKDFYIPSMRDKFKIHKENDNYIIFKIDQSKKLPLIELLAGGNMFDSEFVKKKFPETIENFTLLTHLFYLITSELPYFCITKKDPIIHYSSDSLLGYFKKIEWRIKNNIYFKNNLGKSGYYGREKMTNTKFRKFFFIPYSFSIFLPLIDSIFLTLTRKKLSMLIHFPLCLYTAFLICYHMIIHKFGITGVLTTYDGKTKITEK